MSLTSDDNPVTAPAVDKAPSTPTPAPKSKPAPPVKTGLKDAAASSDPAVVKLMWDRGHRPEGDDAGVARIDDELRKLGFDL